MSDEKSPSLSRSEPPRAPLTEVELLIVLDRLSRDVKGIYVDDRRPRGDLLNFLAAIADALERAFVIENDKQILRLDGCELLVDRDNPRVELELTQLAAASALQGLLFDGASDRPQA